MPMTGQNKTRIFPGIFFSIIENVFILYLKMSLSSSLVVSCLLITLINRLYDQASLGLLKSHERCENFFLQINYSNQAETFNYKRVLSKLTKWWCWQRFAWLWRKGPNVSLTAVSTRASRQPCQISQRTPNTAASYSFRPPTLKGISARLCLVCCSWLQSSPFWFRYFHLLARWRHRFRAGSRTPHPSHRPMIEVILL